MAQATAVPAGKEAALTRAGLAPVEQDHEERRGFGRVWSCWLEENWRTHRTARGGGEPVRAKSKRPERRVVTPKTVRVVGPHRRRTSKWRLKKRKPSR